MPVHPEVEKAYRHHSEIIEHANKMVHDLIRQRDEEVREIQKTLERKCIEEYGGHIDDGSFMYGFCKNCGICLG